LNQLFEKIMALGMLEKPTHFWPLVLLNY
jgi:hypothetical protein